MLAVTWTSWSALLERATVRAICLAWLGSARQHGTVCSASRDPKISTHFTRCAAARVWPPHPRPFSPAGERGEEPPCLPHRDIDHHNQETDAVGAEQINNLDDRQGIMLCVT